MPDKPKAPQIERKETHNTRQRGASLAFVFAESPVFETRRRRRSTDMTTEYSLAKHIIP